MKTDFCQELVAACEGQIEFPSYDGLSYCEKHVGNNGDQIWSYPVDDEGDVVWPNRYIFSLFNRCCTRCAP